MKYRKLALLALLTTAMLEGGPAAALSVDDRSMNDSGGSARYSDPDDDTPGGAIHLQNGQASSGTVDPSTIRYDYDPASGAYVPHRQ